MNIDENFNRHLMNYLDMTGENETLADSFRAGWAACLLEQQRQKALKESRKNKKIVIGDFVCEGNAYESLTGFYCKDGFKIATNKKWLIKVREDYPEEWEHKIISPKTEKEIKSQYVNYERVIPDLSKMIPDGSLTLEGLRVLRSVTSAKSLRNLKKISAIVDGEWIINLSIADRLLKVWESMSDAVLYRPKEDLTKTFMLVKDDNIFVFMPSVGIDANFSYSSVNNAITKAA